MAVCPVALLVVLLCLGGSVWLVVVDARRTRGFMLSARGWKKRWPLYLLSVAAVVAVGFAAQYGC